MELRWKAAPAFHAASVLAIFTTRPSVPERKCPTTATLGSANNPSISISVSKDDLTTSRAYLLSVSIESIKPYCLSRADTDHKSEINDYSPW